MCIRDRCKPVKKDLKEKVQCACGRWMSAHTYRYQHKCKAQTVAQANSVRAPEAQANAAPLVQANAAPEPPKETVPEPEPIAPEIEEKPGPPPKLKRERKVVQEKLPPPEKPIKQKSLIKKQARLAHPLEVPQENQPPPMDIYQAMLFNRQEQARMHHERMLAPYQQMFSLRR